MPTPVRIAAIPTARENISRWDVTVDFRSGYEIQARLPSKKAVRKQVALVVINRHNLIMAVSTSRKYLLDYFEQVWP